MHFVEVPDSMRLPIILNEGMGDPDSHGTSTPLVLSNTVMRIK
jgi:hypothetical protein